MPLARHSSHVVGNATYENAKITPREWYRANKTKRPVLPRTRRPRKPEKANDDTKRPHHRRIKAVFWCDVRTASSHGLAVLLLVEDAIVDYACCDGERDADADGHEGQAIL